MPASVTRPLLLLAASGLARETMAAAAASGREVVGLLDDDPRLVGTEVHGAPVLGPIACVRDHPETDLVVCAGKGSSRRAIVASLLALGIGREQYATVVHPSVSLGTGCTVGVGSILLAGCVLTADVSVGDHVVCMPQVTLTHDDVLADYATLTAGVSLGGGVRVGEAAYIGMNASVREGCTVASDAVLGMGAVLLRDQPRDTVFAGVPARPIRIEE